ncbi:MULTISPECIES: D-alanyl-D-alanine carboxypeptidase/D-alanyl-D-alanine-endopeptidase [Acidobacterium]|uniref:D-alanyl-D-alanine carboxypeptidase/D-alanyl-D-alanine endopeptidase n=1 Tax=Acidobacterium TaxID=33973 RepID=UPI0002D6FFF8|nr:MULTISPECIES: D-alanyl-D-alanine carboxypeptidase/D-alanyl-D-alanine-endopeptidase [Acidobacterium]HCT62291.1 D-alanyl-D-alanine carboxypeptidase/D-alanyl-D-alanine-endopeptidase [Acidobacterium sp.]
MSHATFAASSTRRRLFSGAVAAVFVLLSGAAAHARIHRGPVAHRRPHVYHASLPYSIHRMLLAPGVRQAHWGINVTTLAGAPVYSLNNAQLFHPASNAKLFTTAAVLGLMSPDARWRTQVVTSGQVDAKGTLHGDLILLGSGDPTLSGRVYPYGGHTERASDTLAALEQMADEVVKDGIHRIEGDIIGNDTWFTWQPYGAGWAQDDLTWDYGAPISALTLNDNVAYLNIVPQQEAAQLPNEPGAHPEKLVTPTGTELAEWNPPTPYYYLNNESNLTRATRSYAGIDRRLGSHTVRVFGNIDAHGLHVALAIGDPAQYAAQTFADLLRERGVQIDGMARAEHQLSTDTTHFRTESELPIPLHRIPDTVLGPPSGNMHVLASWLSHATLAQDVEVTLKVSQNLHAELYLRDLGRYEAGEGSFAEGARVIRQFAEDAGVKPGDFFFYDGSGMSHQDVVTPRALTTMLAYAAHQPWGKLYRESLPVGGVDGTLSDRFVSPGMRNRVDAKTGTLSEVNSLSGYVRTRSGRTLVFSILCNAHHPGSYEERAVMDRIVDAIAAQE